MADGIPSKDIARIRQVLARELETINEYEQLARDSESEEARNFFLHLALEEKEHVAEATWLLAKLDPEQMAQYEKDFSKGHLEPTAAPAKPATAPAQRPPQPDMAAYLPETHKLPGEPARVIHALPAPPSPSSGHFTVGPLKRR